MTNFAKQYRISAQIGRLSVIVLGLVLVNAWCGGGRSLAQPVIELEVAPDIHAISLEQPVEVILTIGTVRNVEIQWSLQGPGKLEGDLTGPAVLYAPPAALETASEQAAVTVRVTNNAGQSSSQQRTFTLQASPAPVPTATPPARPTFETKHWKFVPAGEYTLSRYLQRYLGYLGRDTFRIEQAFAIQTGEVTVGDFRRYADSLDQPARVALEPHWRQNPDGQPYPDARPVEYVSWRQAAAYARWLSQQTGWEVRLPTVEQWAAACVRYAENPVILGNQGNQPLATVRGEVDHLLGNLREWSADACGDGKYRLLGENYLTDPTAPNVIGQGYCAASDDQWGGVGFRLIRAK